MSCDQTYEIKMSLFKFDEKKMIYFLVILSVALFGYIILGEIAVYTLMTALIIDGGILLSEVKMLIKEVEDDFTKENLIKQLQLEEYRGEDENLTTGAVICRFDDDETIGHYLAYGTEEDADSVKKDKLAHIIDVILNRKNKIDIAHHGIVFEDINRKKQVLHFSTDNILNVDTVSEFKSGSKDQVLYRRHSNQREVYIDWVKVKKLQDLDLHLTYFVGSFTCEFLPFILCGVNAIQTKTVSKILSGNSVGVWFKNNYDVNNDGERIARIFGSIPQKRVQEYYKSIKSTSLQEMAQEYYKSLKSTSHD